MERIRFALSSFTVEHRSKGWFYGDTYGQDTSQYRGPYTSLASVTLTIARDLQKEVHRRHKKTHGAPLTVP